MPIPKFPFAPVLVDVGHASATLEDRIDDIPNRPINAQTTAIVEELLHESVRRPVGPIYDEKLRAYRLQCCERGFHRFGEWQLSGWKPRTNYKPGYEDDMEATERVHTCDHCGYTESQFYREPTDT